MGSLATVVVRADAVGVVYGINYSTDSTVSEVDSEVISWKLTAPIARFGARSNPR